MEFIIGILGLAFIAVLIWAAVTGRELPPAIKLVLLVAVALVLLLCVLQQTGCQVFVPTPH